MKREKGAAEMPFLDHLEELRSRLIWVAASVLTLSVAGFFIVTQFNIIGLLKRPFVDAMENLTASPDFTSVVPGGQLLFTSPTEPMTVTLKLAFVFGVIMALPIMALPTARSTIYDGCKRGNPPDAGPNHPSIRPVPTTRLRMVLGDAASNCHAAGLDECSRATNMNYSTSGWAANWSGLAR